MRHLSFDTNSAPIENFDQLTIEDQIKFLRHEIYQYVLAHSKSENLRWLEKLSPKNYKNFFENDQLTKVFVSQNKAFPQWAQNKDLVTIGPDIDYSNENAYHYYMLHKPLSQRRKVPLPLPFQRVDTRFREIEFAKKYLTQNHSSGLSGEFSFGLMKEPGLR